MSKFLHINLVNIISSKKYLLFFVTSKTLLSYTIRHQKIKHCEPQKPIPNKPKNRDHITREQHIIIT
jgi:hypothetical protein